MIRNSWNNVKLICGAHGEDHTHEMTLKQGPHSLFYSCPEYKSIFGDKHGKSCNNRLTLVDFEKMLNHLVEESEEADGLVDVDLTGYTWSKNGVTYTVLKHDGDKFEVLMKNDKAMNR